MNIKNRALLKTKHFIRTIRILIFIKKQENIWKCFEDQKLIIIILLQLLHKIIRKVPHKNYYLLTLVFTIDSSTKTHIQK